MSKDKLLQENIVYTKYGLTGKLAEKYLPPPARVQEKKNGAVIKYWRRSDVEQAFSDRTSLQDKADKVREKRKKARQARKARRKAEAGLLSPEAIENAAIAGYVSRFDLEHMMIDAAYLHRRFVLHVGPTNSGKTYDALQALKKAKSGV